MSDHPLASPPHSVDPARRLRSGAWLLQRSWRHPHRLPAGWRSERFAHKVDQARDQLEPIKSLAALTDSFARESIHLSPELAARLGDRGRTRAAQALEVAYVTRFIELGAGRTLRDWRKLSRSHQP